MDDAFEVISIEVPRVEFEKKIVNLIEALLVIDEKSFLNEPDSKLEDAA